MIKTLKHMIYKIVEKYLILPPYVTLLPTGFGLCSSH